MSRRRWCCLMHLLVGLETTPPSLATVPGGKHGYFNDAETKAAYRRIFAFLAKLGLKEE